MEVKKASVNCSLTKVKFELGSKGGSSHLKRLSSPGFWPIPKKTKQWAPKPSPGPHSSEKSLPLLVFIRDVVNLAQTGREAGMIISNGKVKIDGRIIRNKNYPLGLMDVIEILDFNKAYRVIPSSHRFYNFTLINDAEKSFKLCRIENKKILKDGRVQLQCHDGRNLILNAAEGTESNVNQYKVLDVLKFSLENYEILGHYKFDKETYAVIIGGKNIGKHGMIVDIESDQNKARKLRIVKLAGSDGADYSTIPDYLFIVGKDKPIISLPGGSGV